MIGLQELQLEFMVEVHVNMNKENALAIQNVLEKIQSKQEYINVLMKAKNKEVEDVPGTEEALTERILRIANEIDELLLLKSNLENEEGE